MHDGYGGPAALQRFVDACHARGLGVPSTSCTTTSDRAATTSRGSGPTSPSAPHAVGPAVNLDTGAARTVRRFILDNALRWFRDFHVDGLRLDAVHGLDDTQRHDLEGLDKVAARPRAGRPLELSRRPTNDTATVRRPPTGASG